MTGFSDDNSNGQRLRPPCKKQPVGGKFADLVPKKGVSWWSPERPETCGHRAECMVSHSSLKEEGFLMEFRTAKDLQSSCSNDWFLNHSSLQWKIFLIEPRTARDLWSPCSDNWLLSHSSLQKKKFLVESQTAKCYCQRLRPPCMSEGLEWWTIGRWVP